MQRVLKRLAVTESLLTLPEAEDLPKRLGRLAAVLAHRYAEAPELLHAFVTTHEKATVWHRGFGGFMRSAGC